MKSTVPPSGQIHSASVDSTDRKILALLQEDASLSVKEIAAKINLSASPTHERIRKLERDGVISAYVAILNPGKLGLHLTVYCFVVLKEQSLDAIRGFEREVTSLQEVVQITSVSGQYDYMLKVVLQDLQTFNRFYMEKLVRIPNIAHVHSSFVMNEIKEKMALNLNDH